MSKLAIGLPILLATVLAHPAVAVAAERRVAIVLREPGVAAVAEDRVRALVERLWAWGVEVMDASRAQSDADVARIVPEFERRLEGAEASLLYYAGANRTSDASARGPVAIAAAAGEPPRLPLSAMLAAMHARSRTSFAALDLIDRGGERPASSLPLPTAGGHLVTFTTAAASVGADRHTLAVSLVRQLQTAGPALPLLRLAMLAKEDVAVESGGMEVPWVIGVAATDDDIRRMPDPDVQRLRLASLDRLVAEKGCAQGAAAPVQQAVAAYMKAGRRKPVSDPMRLSRTDADDMLWQLRMAPEACRLDDVFAASAPRAEPPVATHRARLERSVTESAGKAAIRAAREQTGRSALSATGARRGQNFSPPSF